MTKKSFTAKMIEIGKGAVVVAFFLGLMLAASYGDTITGVNPSPSHERVQD